MRCRIDASSMCYGNQGGEILDNGSNAGLLRCDPHVRAFAVWECVSLL